MCSNGSVKVEGEDLNATLGEGGPRRGLSECQEQVRSTTHFCKAFFTIKKWLCLNQTIYCTTIDGSNDTPQPTCEFQVDIILHWIKDYPGLS